MTQCNLDFHAIADDARSIAAGRQESPQWLVGALRTSSPATAANLPHRARREVLVIASALNKGEAIVPVAELVEAGVPADTILRTGIDGLSVTSPSSCQAARTIRTAVDRCRLYELVTNRQTDPEDSQVHDGAGAAGIAAAAGRCPGLAPNEPRASSLRSRSSPRPGTPEHDILIRAIAGTASERMAPPQEARVMRSQRPPRFPGTRRDEILSRGGSRRTHRHAADGRGHAS